MKNYTFWIVVVVFVMFGIYGRAEGNHSGVALRKALYYARVGNYKRALKYFKQAIKEEPLAMDPYFNVGNIARHFNECKDQLLYFQGFIFLSSYGGTGADADMKAAKRAIKRCKRAPNVGFLTIVTDTPKLDVLINGAMVGTTPIKDLPLLAGKYTYEIKNPLFQPFSETIEIKPKSTVERHPALVKKTFYGWLKLSTVPKKGVEVYLDGKLIGKTPLQKKIKLKTGKHLLKLKMKGYDIWQRYEEIIKDLTTEEIVTLVKPVKPKKLDMDRWNKFKE